jgi:hypothetical protein
MQGEKSDAGGPEKQLILFVWPNRILSYTLRLSSIDLHVMQNPRAITMVTQSVTPAHARGVYTRPFPLLVKGLGTRLAWARQVAYSIFAQY